MNAFTFPNPPKIWRVTMADADFAFDLASECYSYPLNEDGCRQWMAQALANPTSVFFCRGQNSLGVACMTHPFFDPATTEVHMVYLMARPKSGWEGMRMMRAMFDWAKLHDATFHFGSTTGCDLAPFARRIGAVPDRTSWSAKP